MTPTGIETHLDMTKRRKGRFYAAGSASGSALVLSEPLSFWGGIDVETGTIIDRAHPDLGGNVARMILVMPAGRGSSSSSSVLAEVIRRGNGPLGIILGRPDPILTVGAIVAQVLYDLYCPIVVCPIEGIASGDPLRISRADAGEALIEMLARAPPA